MNEEKWRTWKVAYDVEGNAHWHKPSEGQKYFPYPNANKEIIWKLNEPFKAALKFTGLFHARSATHANFINLETGGKYVMRNSDLEYCIKNTAMIQGVILGLWRFRRDSGRYSVVLVNVLSTYDFEKEK